MAVTPDDVRHVAALARIQVSDERVTALTAELNTILVHMDVLAAVDTTDAETGESVGAAAAPFRQDTVQPAGFDSALSTFAPDMKDGFFLVPRLSTHEAVQDS
jgi:aspartyl-tRNA(Asn)/glutamyl-tRNA(Gln) amidotransferase subunit C